MAEKRGRVENLKAIVVSEDDMKKQKLSVSHKQKTAPRKQLQTAPKKTGTWRKKGLFLQANVSNLSMMYRKDLPLIWSLLNQLKYSPPTKGWTLTTATKQWLGYVRAKAGFHSHF